MGDEMIKMEKTYPPEITYAREIWHGMIKEIQAKYQPAQSDTGTAIAKRTPSTPEGFDRMRRAYQAEIDPIINELVKLEGFAVISYIGNADDFAAMGVSINL